MYLFSNVAKAQSIVLTMCRVSPISKLCKVLPPFEKFIEHVSFLLVEVREVFNRKNREFEDWLDSDVTVDDLVILHGTKLFPIKVEREAFDSERVDEFLLRQI